jgi:hypothetical protein
MSLKIFQFASKITISFLLAVLLIWPLTQVQDYRNEFAPTQHWVNDGTIATTFSWHSNPFDIVSEDFHLYLLRAKRMWELGMDQDIMDGQKFSNLDFRNVLQVILTSPIAIVCSNTDQLAYFYIFYFTCIIGLIWYSFREKGRWPIYSFLGTIVILFSFSDRIYRIGTTLFSGPLLLLLVSLQMSLMIEKKSQNKQTKIWGSSLILLFLLFLDIWAACYGLFLVGVSILINFHSKDFKKSSNSILALLIPLLIFVLITRNLMSVDALLRTGNNFNENDYGKIVNEFFNFHLNKKLMAISILMVLFSRSKKHTLFFIISLLTPITLALVWTFIFNIEITQIFHFYHFQNSVLAWIAIHSIINFEFEKKLIFDTVKWLGIMIPILLGVFIYKPLFYKLGQQSIENKSIGTQGFASWANSSAIEKLINHTKTKTNQKDNIATISYEVAYALAFNSSAKILLPSGFPLHSQKSNLELATAYMSIGQTLGIPKDSLIHYPSFNHPMEQSNWDQGRVKSEKAGFAYNLFHRLGLKKILVMELLKTAKPSNVKVDYVVWEPCLQSLLPKEKINPKWAIYSLIPMAEYVHYMRN